MPPAVKAQTIANAKTALAANPGARLAIIQRLKSAGFTEDDMMAGGL
jgi:hypothetical protein